MKTINNEIIDKVIQFWRSGAEPPLNLGMGNLNPYYGLKLGAVTDITGYPYMGKTLLAKEILVNSYLKHKLKHALYLPDDGDNLEIIQNLIHKLSGKTFDKNYSNNLTENEVYRWTLQILNDFTIYDVNEHHTPIEIWSKSIEDGCQTCTIDSWNTLSHKDTGTKYLAETLNFRNLLAQKHKVHFFTLIHPKNPTSINYNKDGNLKPPTAFDLMGGSEWNNFGKNIIAIHKENKESHIYDVYIRKTKPRIVGLTGQCSLEFHIPSQRFYNIDQEGKKNFFYDNGFTIKEELNTLNDFKDLDFDFNNTDDSPF